LNQVFAPIYSFGMEIRVAQFASPYLTSATRAEELCSSILARWNTEPVYLDFSDVRTTSPSFANTLLLNLLHRVSVEELRERVKFAGMSSHVEKAIERAIERHEKLGIELTAYVPA